MGKAKDTLLHILLRHEARFLLLVLGVATFASSFFPHFLEKADQLTTKIFKLAYSLFADSLFWGVIIFLVGILVILPSMLAYMLMVVLSPIRVCMWELVVILVPVSIGVEYLWEEWYSGSSLARRKRRKQRDVEWVYRRAQPKEDGQKMGAAGQYACTVLIAVPLYFLGELLRKRPYGLFIATMVLVVPITLSQVLSILREVYHRYLRRRLIDMGLSITFPTRSLALPALPIEIWEKIIDYALEVPEYFGTNCEAGDLPDFLAYH
ncbi:hypothetical protein FRC17_002038 [Serendipita sp. 399]|nr:hypothetical protein FRC17_002038 [Serendipita sp. 399]